MMGLIADLVATNRKLLERINVRTWHLEMRMDAERSGMSRTRGHQ
jgi:hypothetical protein